MNQLGNWPSAGKNASQEAWPVDAYNVQGAISAFGISDRICAARGDGRMQCWGGEGAYLGGGNNPPVPLFVTVLVLGFGDALAIGTGSSYKETCAGRTDGRLFCWGLEPFAIEVAHDVIGLSNVGRYVAADGLMYRWSTPTESGGVEPGIDRIVFLDSSAGLVAVRGDGSLWMWNQPLTMTAPTAAWFLATPIQLGGFANIVRADSSGRAVTAALRSDGRVLAWGEGGSVGAYYRLGVADPYATTWHNWKNYDDFKLAFVADLIENAVALSIESTFSGANCALIADGQVLCWGLVAQDSGLRKATHTPRVMPYLP
ncbi:MAG: hypothetical protein R3F39_03795 [Myxococcota bacterium]